jgi:hypothetical protein
MYKQSEKIDGVIVKTRLGALWKGMKSRVKANHTNNVSYQSVSISEDFKDFQIFAEWASSQFNLNFKDEHGNHFDLDKDLINPKLNIYSKETCTFIPRKINIFLRQRLCSNKTLPVGVFARKCGFKVSSTDVDGKYVYLGTYPCVESAAESYRKHKLHTARLLAERYETVITLEAHQKLIEFYERF